MLRLLCLSLVCSVAAISKQAVIQDVGQETLHDWMSKDACLNLALVPQYNNQHSIWGLLEFMRNEGLLKHLTGVSACSGGSLPGVFIAAGKQFQDFKSAFPKNGWLGFGPSEPKITQDYEKFLSVLPKKFEDLLIPFALSGTHWDSEKALKTFVKKESHEIVMTSGDLYPALTTAVATGNNGVIKDDACPKCSFGFWPRTVNGLYPVTDGAFTDIWGTKGLVALPKCSRLLHVLPLDYPGQTKPQANHEIPTNPTDLVTLVVTQPPTGSHSYFHEGQRKKLIQEGASAMKINMMTVSSKSTQQWNHLMFTKAHEGVAKIMNQKMEVVSDSPGSKHYLALVDNAKELRKVQTFKEKVYDAWMDGMRDNFWKFWGSQKGMGDSVKAEEPKHPLHEMGDKALSLLVKPKELGPPKALLIEKKE